MNFSEKREIYLEVPYSGLVGDTDFNQFKPRSHYSLNSFQLIAMEKHFDGWNTQTGLKPV